MKRAKHFKRVVGVGVAAGLALAGLSIGTPADATVNVGEINCDSFIVALASHAAIRNPSVSHVTGPVWAAPGPSVLSIKTEAGLTALPRLVSIATIGSFKDLVNKSQVLGAPGSGVTVPLGPIATGVWLYDPDAADNGGIPNPVPMDGATIYPLLGANGGPYGPFATPTVAVAATPLTTASFDVTTTLDPGAGVLNIGTTPGNPAGLLFTPAVTVPITNMGTVQGQVKVIATSTAVTAVITAPPLGDAITTCGPSATPTHTINVATDGAARFDAHPVVACKPALNTAGVITDKKGWWSNVTPAVPVNDFAGSVTGGTTYGGCNAPDVRLNDWLAPAKHGAAQVEAAGLTTAAVTFKAPHHGDCTQVDELGPSGNAHAADAPGNYEASGVVTVKYSPTKVPASTTYSAVRLVLDSTGGLALPAVRLEANGIVTKGTGLGGAFKFVGEIDAPLLSGAAGIIACNAGAAAPAVGVFYGAGGLNFKTGPDAVLQISAP